MAQIDNNDKFIDSRDIIKRIEELRDELNILQAEIDETAEDGNYMGERHQAALKELVDWNEDNAEELASLEAFAEEASQYSSDWTYGETLINESYWVDYCKELVSDIGDMPCEIPSYIEIDWEATADNLAADYVKVDFDGTDFYIRNS